MWSLYFKPRRNRPSVDGEVTWFLLHTICFLGRTSYFAHHLRKRQPDRSYEGHSRIRDNKSIYQKILPESELFVTQNVDIGVAYSCLKYCFYHN